MMAEAKLEPPPLVSGILEVKKTFANLRRNTFELIWEHIPEDEDYKFNLLQDHLINLSVHEDMLLGIFVTALKKKT